MFANATSVTIVDKELYINMDLPDFYHQSDLSDWLSKRISSYLLYSDEHTSIYINKTTSNKYYIKQEPFILTKDFIWKLNSSNINRDEILFDNLIDAYNHFRNFIKYDNFLTCHTPIKPQNIIHNIVDYIIEKSKDESRSDYCHHSVCDPSKCK